MSGAERKFRLRRITNFGEMNSYHSWETKKYREIYRMKSLTRSFVCWPKIDGEIENLVKNCTVCQVTPKVLLQQWTWPVRKCRFCRKNRIKFLTPFDSISKWLEDFPMTSTNAEATVSKMRTYFSTYGVPENIVPDWIPPFQSNVL